jgi:polyisoprenoid-binding protein YceI
VNRALLLLAPPVALLALLLLPAAAPAPTPPRALESWVVDSGHSSLVFRIRHMGVSNFYGRFNELSGRLALADNAAQNSLTFSVQAASVDTNSDKRDQHLKSPDFFSAKEFPVIEFRSTSVKPAGDGALDVAGKLTLHGVTRDLAVKVQETGRRAGDGEHPGVAGFEARFTIKRSDFGMDYGVEQGSLGDEVELVLAVEAQQE